LLVIPSACLDLFLFLLGASSLSIFIFAPRPPLPRRRCVSPNYGPPPPLPRSNTVDVPIGNTLKKTRRSFSISCMLELIFPALHTPFRICFLISHIVQPSPPLPPISVWTFFLFVSILFLFFVSFPAFSPPYLLNIFSRDAEVFFARYDSFPQLFGFLAVVQRSFSPLSRTFFPHGPLVVLLSSSEPPA